MRCPFAEWIPSPNYSGGFNEPVRTRLQHTTVGTWDQSLRTLTSVSAQVSAHFLIGFDGRLAQLVDTDNRAWHARAANEFAWGIEHVDNGKYWDGVRTPEQYATSARLNRWLGDIGKLQPTADTMERHLIYVNTACPDALDVERIILETAGGDMADYVPRADFDAFVAGMKNTVAYIADRLAKDAHHTHGPSSEPIEPKAGLKKRGALATLGDVDLSFLEPSAPPKKAKRPSAAAVRAGHGK